MEAVRQAHHRRLLGVVTFVTELAQALRQEFEPHWLDAEARAQTSSPAAPPAEDQAASDERLTRLRARVEALEERAQAARELLTSTTAKGTIPALQALNAFDVNGITTAARGLEVQARMVRIDRVRQAQAAAKAPEPAVATTGVVAYFRRMAGDPEILKADEAAKAAQAAQVKTVAQTKAEQQRQAFDGVCTFMTGVMAYVEPRAMVLKESLHVTALPGKRLPWPQIEEALEVLEDEGDLPPTQLQWIALVASVIVADIKALQAVHLTVVRWDEAKRLSAEAELLRLALGNAPAERASRLLDAFDLAKLRAAIYPLSHLHLTFRELPKLAGMFPAPAQ